MLSLERWRLSKNGAFLIIFCCCCCFILFYFYWYMEPAYSIAGIFPPGVWGSEKNSNESLNYETVSLPSSQMKSL